MNKLYIGDEGKSDLRPIVSVSLFLKNNKKSLEYKEVCVLCGWSFYIGKIIKIRQYKEREVIDFRIFDVGDENIITISTEQILYIDFMKYTGMNELAITSNMKDVLTNLSLSNKKSYYPTGVSKKDCEEYIKKLR